MTEKTLYQQVTEEMEAGTIDNALWSMAWAKSEGDEARARARYVEERVSELKVKSVEAAKQSRRNSLKQQLRRWPVMAITALGFAIAYQAVVNSIMVVASRAGWDFYLIGVVAGACGYLAVAALVVLVSWGRLWGFRIAFLALLLAGCLAGIDTQLTDMQLRGKAGKPVPVVNDTSRAWYVASDGHQYLFEWGRVADEYEWHDVTADPQYYYAFKFQGNTPDLSLERAASELEGQLAAKRGVQIASAKGIYKVLLWVCLGGWAIYAWSVIARNKHQAQIEESNRLSNAIHG